jgi:hypothetical protein
LEGWGSALVSAATVTAIQDLVPVFGPAFAPNHGAAANQAGFLRQALLVAFEAGGLGHIYFLIFAMRDKPKK